METRRWSRYHRAGLVDEIIQRERRYFDAYLTWPDGSRMLVGGGITLTDAEDVVDHYLRVTAEHRCDAWCGPRTGLEHPAVSEDP